MKNKTSRNLLNGVFLAAIAAVGVTAYQLMISPIEDEMIPNEVRVEMEKAEDTQEQEESVDADTVNVMAEMKKKAEVPEITKVGDSAEKQVEADAGKIHEIGMAGDKEDVTEAAGEIVQNDAEEEISAVSASAGVAIPPAAYLKFSENTLMEWPVHGNILLDYDMDQTTYFPTLDQYRLNPAISVQAAEGAPVVASVDGVVYKIVDDPRTGMTVTMELGNGYQAIYGLMKDLTVYEGETVERGTTIGYVDAPTKYYSEEGSNLYFAMKKDGEPIDPIMYLP